MGKIYLKCTQLVPNYGQIYSAPQHNPFYNVDMPQQVFGGVGEGGEWLTQGAQWESVANPWTACQELSFPGPWTLAVLLLDSPWHILLPVSGRVKKKNKSLNSAGGNAS